jgi:hypothetical protein
MIYVSYSLFKINPPAVKVYDNVKARIGTRDAEIIFIARLTALSRENQIKTTNAIFVGKCSIYLNTKDCV